jgi:hypothetical protein
MLKEGYGPVGSAQIEAVWSRAVVFGFFWPHNLLFSGAFLLVLGVFRCD